MIYCKKNWNLSILGRGSVGVLIDIIIHPREDVFKMHNNNGEHYG